MRVTVSGDAANWTVIINKTCSDNYYHWTSDTELTNCVEYVCGFLADRTAARSIMTIANDRYCTQYLSLAIVMILSPVCLYFCLRKCIVALRVGVRG